MDAAKIWKQREITEEWLSGAYYWAQHFVKTSEHPAWQGKVKCRYCKRTGWPQDIPNDKWWGHKHGQHCKWKELYDLKRMKTGALHYNTNVGNLAYFTGSQWITATTTTASSYIRAY